jgi:hypothetical protein
MNKKNYLITNEPVLIAVRDSSTALGVYAGLAASALVLPALFLVPHWRSYWPAAVVLVLAVGISVTAIAGTVYTSWAAAARLAPGPSDHPIPLATSLVPPSEPAVLQLTARRILEIRFLAGMDATRPQCQQLYGILQADWNLINACFKLIGVKAERRWLVNDHAQALRLWIDCVRIDADRSIWCRTHPESSRWIKVNKVMRV